MKIQNLILLLIIIFWLLRRRRLAKTSQAANQSNISAPEQQPAAPNSKFEPLFNFVIPEAKIRKQQEEEAKTNTSGSTSLKRSRTMAKFEPTGFGLLYSGYTIDKGKNICPNGFRIPTHNEIIDILSVLSSMKSTNANFWEAPNTGASSLNNFHITGAGNRNFNNGSFSQFKTSSRILGEGSSISDNYSSYVRVTNTGYFEHSTQGTVKSVYSILPIMENPALWYEGMTVTDIDGNIYGTAKIRDKVFLTSFLAVTRYNDGTPILNANDTATYLAAVDYITGREACYCYPNGEFNNVGKTSQLY